MMEATLYPESMNLMLERCWQPLRSGRFSSTQLASFLAAAGHWSMAGSTTSVLGRVLAAEQQRDRVRFRCQDWVLIPKTTRIDRLLPLQIPRPFPIEGLATELLDQCPSLGLPAIEPGQRQTFGTSASAGFLAILHSRRLELEHGLFLDLRLECPASASGRGRRNELTLMGYLPLGGRVVVATSRMAAEDVLTMNAAEVEHTSRLLSRWTGDGLQLEEPPRACLSAS